MKGSALVLMGIALGCDTAALDNVVRQAGN